MYEEKVISRDSGTCTVFHQYAPPRLYDATEKVVVKSYI